MIQSFLHNVEWLSWTYWLVLVLVAGLVGLFVNILGLPGLWLMVAGVVAYAWLTGWHTFVGTWPVVSLILLGLLAELVEFLAGSAGVASAGGSKRGMAGAIIGGLVGGIAGSVVIPVPVVGTIIGAVGGTFGGAILVEKLWVGRTHEESLRIGIGAAKGRFIGIVSKSAIGVVMLVVALITTLPFGRTVVTPVLVSVPTTLPTINPTTVPETGPTSTPAVER